MLQFFLHDQPRELFRQFATALSVLQRDDPLRPVTVLTPNPGMARWLQLSLAREHGVCANVHFARPASFIWQRLRACEPNWADVKELNSDTLRWAVFSCLHRGDAPERLLTSPLPGEPGEQLNLATLFGQIFNDYQLFDPQRVLRWSKGEEQAHEQAQAALWRLTLARAATPSAASLLERLPASARLGEGDAVLGFNIGDISPLYLHALQDLAADHLLPVFLPTLSSEYWGDLDRHARRQGVARGGAGLLAAFGQRERDLLERLLEAGEHQQIDIDSMESGDTGTANSALKRLQQAIRQIEASSNACPQTLADGSLKVLACPSRLREVQVVRDAILRRLHDDPSLQPHDIIVLTPDVSGYLPYLQGVFADPALPPERRLTLNISDGSLGASHPLLDVFSEWLRLPRLRMTASRLSRWLEEPAIRRAFGLNAEDAEQLRDWLVASGVRWGIDANDREQELGRSYEDYSWRAGLDRLLLGTMHNGADNHIAGVFGYPDIEGHAATALGGLSRLMQHIERMRQAMRLARTAKDWQAWWLVQLEQLLDCDPQDAGEQRAWQALMQLLQTLDTAAEILGEEALEAEVIAQTLEAQLAGPGTNRAFLGGGISVAGMVPLRTIPARLIVLLGLNDDTFPRSDDMQSLSLLAPEQRRRLLSRRDDDRLLFLQAIMAADEALYISYTSRIESSGENRPPSAAVSEWMDTLAELFATDAKTVSQHIIEHHPLHVFSQAYTQAGPDPRLASFDAPRGDVGHHPQTVLRAARASDTTQETTDSLTALQRRLIDPFGLWLSERGDLLLRSDHLSMLDDEPLLPLDTLSQYALNRALIGLAEQHDCPPPSQLDTPDTVQRLLGQGLLPPGEQAQEALRQHLSAYQAWLAKVIDQIAMRGPAQAAHFQVAGLQVDLPDLRRGGLLRWQPSQFKYKHLIDWWLGAVAALSQGPAPPPSRLVLLDSKAQARQYQLTLAVNDASEVLRTLLPLAKQWREQPPPLSRQAWDRVLSDGLNKQLHSKRSKPEDPVEHCQSQLTQAMAQLWSSTQTRATRGVSDREAWLVPWALRSSNSTDHSLQRVAQQASELIGLMQTSIEVVDD